MDPIVPGAGASPLLSPSASSIVPAEKLLMKGFTGYRLESLAIFVKSLIDISVDKPFMSETDS